MFDHPDTVHTREWAEALPILLEEGRMVPYWVVFRDDSSTIEPSVLGKHTQKREAVARAERLAIECPGAYFAIAMVTSRVRTGVMEWEDAVDG